MPQGFNFRDAESARDRAEGRMHPHRFLIRHRQEEQEEEPEEFEIVMNNRQPLVDIEDDQIPDLPDQLSDDEAAAVLEDEEEEPVAPPPRVRQRQLQLPFVPVEPNAARLLRDGDNAPYVNQRLWNEFTQEFVDPVLMDDGLVRDCINVDKFLRAVTRAQSSAEHDYLLRNDNYIRGMMYRLFNPQVRMESALFVQHNSDFCVNANDPFVNYTMIRDMKMYLLLFLLNYLFRLSEGAQHEILFSFLPMNQPEAAGRATLRNCGRFLRARGENLIPFNRFLGVFDQVYTTLKNLIVDDVASVKWYEKESGEVFIYLLGGPFTMRLENVAFGPYRFGGRWKDRFKDILEDIFKEGGYITVKNKDDPFCFLYVLAIGIARCNDPGFMRTPQRFYTKENVCCSILYGTECPQARRITDAVMMSSFTDDLKQFEKQVAKLCTLQEFNELMVHTEDRFVPIEYALDVYLLDSNVSKRLYPVYSSLRDGTRIKMMIIRDGEDCHFCLITQEDKVFRATSGKLFITCSRCHQAFFTQKMFDTHPCRDPSVDHNWHWNSICEGDVSEVIGRCDKCHLQFKDEYEYNYHIQHCLMIGRSGHRYVRLVGDDYALHGEEPKTSENPVDRVCFADFECCIDFETGAHSFMSYGLYDVASEKFEIGFDIQEFVSKLVEYATTVKHLKVYFHNAMGYDANFILSHILNTPALYRDWGIRVIMKSATKLQRLSFMFDVDKSKHIIEIGDTLHFLTMSLDKIVRSVRKDVTERNVKNFPLFFTEFRKRYPGVPDEEIDLILRKNLFPYNFFQTPEVLDCPIEDFKRVFEPVECNLLSFGENVTLEDLRANLPLFNHVCETFEVRDARDYHNLYLMCDVMQIADVFLQARDTLKETHHIDLHDYMGMPSASWHAFLRHDPSLTLPLYKNTIFAEFFQDMVRGGVTSAPLRYAFADMNHSILYLDVNGLYPFVMKEFKYPCGDFIWRDFKNKPEDGPRRTEAPIYDPETQDPQKYLMEMYFPWLRSHNKGCCICVDMVIPPELKEKTDQFPFAPEHRVIQKEYFDENGKMYEFFQRWSDKNDGARIQPFRGLVGTLYDKKEYSVHWVLLEWYIQHGLRVTKLHHCVEFDEGDYLAGYVSKNIEIRNTRTDELGKIVYKLLGNSVYGKTFESPFNHGKFIICRNHDALRGLLEHDEVLSITPIDANNSVIKLDGDEIVLDKPTYIGACVTEYAKLHMYRIFYDKLPKMFNKVELVYTDTDSFIVRVEHYDNMTPEKLFQHISECDPDFIGSKGGQLKSETGMDLIDEVIALRSKVYAYRTKSGKIGKRAKGTTAAAQERELDWETYKEALIELRAIPTHNTQFLRRGFQVRTHELMKVSLSANDGKRQILSDGIHTHAWGY